MKLSIATIAAVASSATVVLGFFGIPGIVSVDVGGTNGGLKLSVLGGLIQANIGGHQLSGKRPPATNEPKPSIAPLFF
ncbi:hypothetical protein IWQ57_001105 [Coemansia nantahalensis]|uniref:Uncharacterized protein n=2 Tax=Coemansia TaxID=4863 RepID=A0ACC1L445_9FUNG|nr:hypothetical protein IWQ57_001105 [Coemansia nantahalensis]KAJ2800546.1 hypothetical protein H4R21_003132 [Coemansia helicoidea]